MYDLQQARWSLYYSCHSFTFRATVKVSKVKAVQNYHDFCKKNPALFRRNMSFARKAPEDGWINHSYKFIPYIARVHSVQCTMHSNQWKLCGLDPVHCIEKITSTSVCLLSSVTHQLLNTMDILKWPGISLFHPFFSLQNTLKFRFALKAQMRLFWMK